MDDYQRLGKAHAEAKMWKNAALYLAQPISRVQHQELEAMRQAQHLSLEVATLIMAGVPLRVAEANVIERRA